MGIEMNTGGFLLYQTEDGQTRIEVRLQDETVWLSQKLMAELFQTSRDNISLHLKNIYTDGELEEAATTEDFSVVRQEGPRQIRRELKHYNLDVIISVGYRVHSHRGTQFRIWATQRLREYLIKGFTMDDERLKQAGGGNYFDELLERIRDIRSSEKVFWRKVLDIYATSIDYDPKADLSHEFFAIIQNKMHWAAHGHTAAELILERVDADKPNMGMTSWAGDKPRKTDAAIAKNYLDEKELQVLNRIVTAYLEFAELQALEQRPMYMRNWISKLDDFLKLSEREILNHAGSVSQQQALDKAEEEYDRFRHLHLQNESAVERHFNTALEEIKRIKKSDRQESGDD